MKIFIQMTEGDDNHQKINFWKRKETLQCNEINEETRLK